MCTPAPQPAGGIAVSVLLRMSQRVLAGRSVLWLDEVVGLSRENIIQGRALV